MAAHENLAGGLIAVGGALLDTERESCRTAVARCSSDNSAGLGRGKPIFTSSDSGGLGALSLGGARVDPFLNHDGSLGLMMVLPPE
jgi:hypothetical protein